VFTIVLAVRGDVNPTSSLGQRHAEVDGGTGGGGAGAG
jgi:hypothetical protein